MFLSPVTEQEIEFIIQSLNSQKAIGPCSIPVFLLKTLTKHFAKPLSAIVNLSFQAGVFPDNLKVAKVNPLHKRTPVIIHQIIDLSLFLSLLKNY